MSHSIKKDVEKALKELEKILNKNGGTSNSVVCYDPALDARKAFKCPGGPQMLLRETLPGYDGDLLYHFMRIMKERGVTSGKLYIHLKCLYLFEVHQKTTFMDQYYAAQDVVNAVFAYNMTLGVQWEVITEEEGSAPIPE